MHGFHKEMWGQSVAFFPPNSLLGCQTLDPLPSLPLPQEKGSVRKALAEGRPHVGRGRPGARGGPLPHRRRPLQGGPILALLTTTERVSDASVFAVSPENASENRPGGHPSIREGIRTVAIFLWRVGGASHSIFSTTHRVALQVWSTGPFHDLRLQQKDEIDLRPGPFLGPSAPLP